MLKVEGKAFSGKLISFHPGKVYLIKTESDSIWRDVSAHESMLVLPKDLAPA